MKNMAKVSISHKILSCLLGGLVSGAVFHRVASRFMIQWLPPVAITALALLILAGAVIFIFVWISKEKRSAIHSDPTLAFWQGCIRVVIAFDLCLFGWQKIFGLQFFTPLGMLDEPFSNLSGEWLTWSYFGRSYPMILSIAFFQMAGGFLLLFRRTRLIGLFLVIPVMLNVLLIDIFYKLPPGVTVHAFFIVCSVFYLLLSEYDRLKAFFLDREGGCLPVTKVKTGIKKFLRISIAIIPFLLVFMYTQHHKAPVLRGKYEVSKIQINGINKTADLPGDSILSVAYFDLGNDCVFEFRDYTQRMYGIFDHTSQDNKVSIQWMNPHSAGKMQFEFVPAGDKKWKLSGKLGNDLIVAELLKVK